MRSGLVLLALLVLAATGTAQDGPRPPAAAVRVSARPVLRHVGVRIHRYHVDAIRASTEAANSRPPTRDTRRAYLRR